MLAASGAALLCDASALLDRSSRVLARGNAASSDDVTAAVTELPASRALFRLGVGLLVVARRTDESLLDLFA